MSACLAAAAHGTPVGPSTASRTMAPKRPLETASWHCLSCFWGSKFALNTCTRPPFLETTLSMPSFWAWWKSA